MIVKATEEKKRRRTFSPLDSTCPPDSEREQMFFVGAGSPASGPECTGHTKTLRNGCLCRMASPLYPFLPRVKGKAEQAV